MVEIPLFCWREVPGKDEKRLLNHLQKCLGIEGIIDGKLERNEEEKLITISLKNLKITVKLDEENNRVLLEAPDGTIYEYSLIKREGKHLVYVKNLLFILREIDVEDEEMLEKLARSIVEESYKAPKKIIEIHHSEDEDDSSKATAIILEIENLALTPLLEGLRSEDAERYVWDMRTIIDIQVENRIKIAKILEEMLDDKRQLPQPITPPGGEEKPPPRRVCDEAYLMLRRLLSLDESEEEQYFNSIMFLELSDEEKDEEIRKFKSTKKWKTYIILQAGWEKTASQPYDLGATNLKCRVFCHFGCSSRLHYWHIVRRGEYKGWKRPKPPTDKYAYFTTRPSDSKLTPIWLYYILTYNKRNNFKPWWNSLEYAKKKTNRKLRLIGADYQVY